MLLIRLSLALLAALILPASALADLRSPVLGDASTLSDVPQSRTYQPATASDGNTTYVAYLEQRGGVMLNRISAAGTEVGAPTQLSQPGTVVTDYPRVAVSGEHVYVSWIEAGHEIAEVHAMVATSRDGGRSFGVPRIAGRPTGYGAWDLQLAADGDNVFLTWVDNRDRVWTAGSRDGGHTFPCQAPILPAGDEVDGGGDYALAVDGDTVIWTWTGADRDIWVRRSPDAGRTLEPPFKAFDTPTFDTPGTPSIVADDGNVAIAFSKEHRFTRPNGSVDFGWDAVVYSSQDGGRSWAETPVSNSGNRCWGDYCQAPYGMAISGDDVYVGWRGQGSMWLGHSRDGGRSFDDATQLGPYAYTWHTQQMPHVAARGDTVVATWHTAPNAGMFDMDPIAAFSSDRGASFTLRTVDDRAGQDLLPVAAAWGPDPQGAGFSWLSLDHTWLNGDRDVRFVPLSASEPDIEVIDVRPLQAASDAARLAAGRPTTIRALVRSRAPQRLRAPLKIDLAYDQDGDRVERAVEEEVILRPGLNVLQLLAAEPVKVGAGRISAKVTVDPEIPDSDPGNNVGEGSRAVVQPRPLKVLFVPVAADDELLPACGDVRAVADGAEQYLKASWPLDPEHVSVVTDCTTRLVHAAGLTEAGLMDTGGLMARLDRQKFAGQGIDKVVGVVPQGWFSRQLIDGFAEAVGIAPIGSTLDTAIVERQNTGGWVVAHELAHNLGWTEEEGHHLNDEPAPGYWVTERRDIPSRTLDFMQFSTAGASVTDPVGRWLSKKTWDFLTITLSTGEIRGLSAQRVLSLAGSVAKDGTVKVDKLWELDGGPETGSDGPLMLEQLGADGTVLHTQRFGASNALGPIGNDQAKRDAHIETELAAFSLRVPVIEAARRVRIRRGEDVVYERARSGAAPQLEVKTPEDVQIGADLALEWSASDADGDALTHFVSLSTDGGTSWRPLGEQLTASALTVKALAALAGSDVRVRVTTSDGWNTVSAESGSFAIGGTLADGKLVFDAFGGGVWTADFDGGGVERIVRNGSHPRWSPDGRRVVFQDSAIGIVNGDGTGERRIGGSDWLTPFWTPDGDRVIARKPGESASFDAETGESAPFGLAGPQYCGYSRDGSLLLGPSSLYQHAFAFYDGDGKQPRNLSRAIRGYHCMSLSPDGRQGVVARVTGDSDSVIDVIVYDLETGAERNLTNHQFGGFNEHPTWSPTGDWIVWGSNRDRGGNTGFGSTDLWKIRPDGTGATKIVDGAPTQRAFRRPDVQPLRGTDPDPEPTLEDLEPVATAGGPYEVAEGAQVTVSAAGSRPGQDGVAIASTAWDLDGDGTYEAAGASVKASFPDEGTYPVSVLVTDVKGRFSTAVASVKVTNAAPAIANAVVGDGAPANFSARIADPGAADELTAKLYWDGSDVAETVPVIASGDGHVVFANRPGPVATVRIVVSDGDGGRAEASSQRVLKPSNGAPGADDASASVVAGESVDIDLPARDPEGERLRYEIVDAPEHGTLSMRAPLMAPDAPDVTFVAAAGSRGRDRFTYRVSDGEGQSRVATVTVDVKPAPDSGVVVVPPDPRPAEPELPEAPRTALKGTKPVDERAVAKTTARLGAAAEAATVARYVTLPSTRKCLSRRNFVINVEKADARALTVHVDGKRVKVVRGKAKVDLRGLPKGRFKVKIAVTLKDGKVARSTRQYRTCTPKKTKKGGRA